MYILDNLSLLLLLLLIINQPSRHSFSFHDNFVLINSLPLEQLELDTLRRQFRAPQTFIVSARAEDVSVCWWMPSPIITPQSRKHMKRIFGHSFHSVTTFLKRQPAAGRCGDGRSLCYCLFLPLTAEETREDKNTPD